MGASHRHAAAQAKAESLLERICAGGGGAFESGPAVKSMTRCGSTNNIERLAREAAIRSNGRGSVHTMSLMASLDRLTARFVRSIDLFLEREREKGMSLTHSRTTSRSRFRRNEFF